MDGLSLQFLTPESPLVNMNISVSVYISGIFWMLFVRSFLQIEKYSKDLDRIYKILIGAFIVCTMFSFVFVRIETFLTSPMWILALLVNIGAGVYCLRKGNENARIYLIATFIFLIGSFLRIFRIAGIEQASFFTESALQIGIVSEMTLLSFALGSRINRIRADNEREKAMVRSRIAGDLHDEIGSNLSSISVASQMISKSGKLDESDKRQLWDITTTAKETADSIRDIIWFINPEHDKIEDLIFRMQETAAKLLQGIECHFDSAESEIIKSKDLQFRRNLFLIYKEILNNIVKHSKACQVQINLEETSNEFRLQVTDNGVGFDEKNIDPRHGEGIKNLKRRAADIDCDLKISSEVGKGTTVELRMKV